METKYTPELVMQRKVCKGCGESTLEFIEIKKPYFCSDCNIKFMK